MSLTREHIDLLGQVINAIKDKKPLTQELLKQLYWSKCITSNGPFRKHFNEFIIPNLSDEELFKLTLSIISAHKEYCRSMSLLRGSDLLSGDLYVACAQRFNYKNPGTDDALPMEVLNWYVYQDRLDDTNDLSSDKKKTAAVLIRFKLKPKLNMPELVTQQEMIEIQRKIKEIDDIAKQPSEEEINKIINLDISGTEADCVGYSFVKATKSLPERVKNMRGSIIPEPTPELTRHLIIDNKIEARQKAKQRAWVAELENECHSYQNHCVRTIENHLHDLQRKLRKNVIISDKKNDVLTKIDDCFNKYHFLKKSRELTIVKKALAEVGAIYNLISPDLTNEKNKQSFELALQKAQALNELMINSFRDKAMAEGDKLEKFSKEFAVKKAIFLQLADRDADEFVRKIKKILVAATLGVAAIPLAIYSKAINDSFKFWKTKTEMFVETSEKLEKMIVKPKP